MFNKTFGQYMFNENKRHTQGSAGIACGATLIVRGSTVYKSSAAISSVSSMAANGALIASFQVSIVGPGAIQVRAIGVRTGDILIESSASVSARGIRSPVVGMVFKSEANVLADAYVFTWVRRDGGSVQWNPVAPDGGFWSVVYPAHVDWKKVRA